VSRTLRPLNSDCEELRRVLSKLREENADFRVDDEDVEGQVIVRAMSELRLEVICDRLAREHNFDVECGKPEIIYLETIRDTSAAEGKFISQSGGRGYYAHVAIRIEPNPTKGYELINEMPEGAIPDKYVDPIDQGIRYALESGVAGHEMIDIKVTLCDGSYHEGDSDEAAFETAGFMAMKEAVEVVVPQQWTGSVVSDLQLRRAEVTGIEGHEGEQVIHAIARLAEIIGYAADLRSITQERTTYAAKLLCYRQVGDLPPAGDDRVGVTANKPWKPKPKRGAEAVEPLWLESTY
jgi:elongation factor G